jgi:hypothetical protein
MKALKLCAVWRKYEWALKEIETHFRTQIDGIGVLPRLEPRIYVCDHSYWAAANR